MLLSQLLSTFQQPVGDTVLPHYSEGSVMADDISTHALKAAALNLSSVKAYLSFNLILVLHLGCEAFFVIGLFFIMFAHSGDFCLVKNQNSLLSVQ
jgi:hypothetical protein